MALATRLGAKPTGAFVIIATDGALASGRVLTGTSNQITVTDNGAGSTVVLSLPQSIHTGATPTFAGGTLTGTLNCRILLPSSATTYDLGGASNEWLNVYGRSLISGGTLTLTGGGGGGSINMGTNGVTAIVAISSTLVTISKPVTISNAGAFTGTGSATWGDAAGTNRAHAFYGHTTFTPGIDASTGGPVVIMKGYTGQTLDLLQWQDSTAVVLGVVSAAGFHGLGVTTPLSVLHLKAGTATANTAPLQFNAGTFETVARAGVVEYNNRFAVTESDATRRYVVQAAASTKTTAGAPYTNDGYVTVTINGTDVKILTTA